MGGSKRTAFLCVGLALGMLGLSFAAVPLYEAFCRITGYGGTPQAVAGLSAPIILDRKMEIRFDANLAPDLAWSFGPNEKKVTVQVGEIAKTTYYAQNLSDKTIMGRAVYNVVPNKAGYYFSKIHCFCFEEQTLKAGEKIDMPIIFYVDPELDKDKEMADVEAITLSYTFYSVKQDPKREGR